ncbi:ribosomal silencing factor RsfS [bacterium BMS3Abin05]|nr:ribosomal silencing factor RsfS [bacterium BMS3Abin05]GBE28623.1 ribosomal silencing factor RsfS [bacterium BMS3Bbin03]
MTKAPLMHEPSSHEIAQRIANLALSKKATDIKILDVKELTSVTDFFVICSGDSDLHIKAIVDEVLEKMKADRILPWHKEGYENLQWVLVDFVDVVVHIFRREVREFYGLETLWGDAKTEEVKDSDES